MCQFIFVCIITKIVSWISDNCSAPLFLLIIGFILEQNRVKRKKASWLVFTESQIEIILWNSEFNIEMVYIYSTHLCTFSPLSPSALKATVNVLFARIPLPLSSVESLKITRYLCSSDLPPPPRPHRRERKEQI